MSKISEASQNPITEGWSYHGTFSIELNRDNEKIITLPKNLVAVLAGKMITIEKGSLYDKSPSLEIFDSANKTFFLSYRYVKCVRNNVGEIIWRNRTYKDYTVLAMVILVLLIASCSPHARHANTADRNAVRHHIFALQKERTRLQSKDINIYSQDSIEAINDTLFVLDDSLMTTKKY